MAAQDPLELLPVVDGEDRLLGTATRERIHREGLTHRAVHVLVFDPEGRIYLQRRSPEKDTHPGKWTTSASGHVDPGESYDDAACRELHEELDLMLPLEFMQKLPACQKTENEFSAVYKAVTGEPPRPNPEEISEGRFHTWEEAMDLAADGNRATPSLRVVLEAADKL